MTVVNLVQRTLLATMALLATTAPTPVDAALPIQTAGAGEGGFLSIVGSSRKLLHGCHRGRCLDFCPRCKFPKDSDIGHCKRNKKMFVCTRDIQGNEGDEGDEGNEGNAPPAADSAGPPPAKRRSAAQRLAPLPNPNAEVPTFYREYGDYVVQQGSMVTVEYEESYEFDDEHAMPDGEVDDGGGGGGGGGSGDDASTLDDYVPVPAPAVKPATSDTAVRDDAGAVAAAQGRNASADASVTTLDAATPRAGASREAYVDSQEKM